MHRRNARYQPCRQGLLPKLDLTPIQCPQRCGEHLRMYRPLPLLQGQIGHVLPAASTCGQKSQFLWRWSSFAPHQG